MFPISSLYGVHLVKIATRKSHLQHAITSPSEIDIPMKSSLLELSYGTADDGTDPWMSYTRDPAVCAGRWIIDSAWDGENIHVFCWNTDLISDSDSPPSHSNRPPNAEATGNGQMLHEYNTRSNLIILTTPLTFLRLRYMVPLRCKMSWLPRCESISHCPNYHQSTGALYSRIDQHV